MDPGNSIDNNTRMKIKTIIDNSIILLEKKISTINKELQSLKNDYLEELVKLNEIIDSKSAKILDSNKFNLVENSIKKLKQNKILTPPLASMKSLEGINSSTIGSKDESRDMKTISLPSMYKKETTPNKHKQLIGNNSIYTTKSNSDSIKGIINYKNIRNEMVKKDKYTIKGDIKKKIEFGKNSKTPSMFRNDSIKSNPVASLFKEKEAIINREDATNSEISRERSVSKDSSNNDVILKTEPKSEIKNHPILVHNDRKFSILDIPCSFNENFQKISDHGIKQITNKRDKALYVLVNSKVVPLRLRITFAFLTKYKNTFFNLNQILDDGLNTMINRMKFIEGTIPIIDYFKPSKTAQNAINFITKENIEDLKNCDDNEIKNIFKCFNIISGIEDNNNNIINNFFENNKEPLKLFILNYISRKINYSLTEVHVNKFISFMKENESLTNLNVIYSINKTASLLLYYIKELYEYMNKIKNIDLKKLYEYRSLNEELRVFEKLKK